MKSKGNFKCELKRISVHCVKARLDNPLVPCNLRSLCKSDILLFAKFKTTLNNSRQNLNQN